MKSTLHMEIAPPPLGTDEPLGLLVPEPIDTAEQRFVGFEAHSSLGLELVHGLNSCQRARWIGQVPHAPISLYFVFLTNETRAEDHLYQRFENRFTDAPRDLSAAVSEVLAGANDEAGRLRRVVDFVSARMTYGPRNIEFETPKLVCGVAGGNCVDINTVLLAACYVAEIEASYRAGFYFRRPQAGAVADGMHCWISTRSADGSERHWDIAHCKLAGLDPVRPGLNPAGGLRMAMSYGRGLRFGLGNLDTEPISHFARPHWAYSDGSLVEAGITVRLHAVEPWGAVETQIAL